MVKRMNMHRNPPSKCTGTQLFALGDPEWSILEIVPTESAAEREEWHITNTRPATNVNAICRPMEGDKLRMRIIMKKWQSGRDLEKNRQKNRDQRKAKNAEAVALGHKNHYHRLKAERTAAGFII